MSDLGGRADFDEFTQISFGAGEEATELFGEQACADAVATGRIGVATPLTVYRRDGTIQHVTADRVPLFRRLLGLEVETVARAEKPAASGTQPLVPLGPPRVKVRLASPPLPPPAPTLQGSAPAVPVPSPPPPQQEPYVQPVFRKPELATRSWIWPVMLALILTAVLIARIGGRSSEPEPVATATSSPEPSQSPVDPDAALEQQTLYSVRTVELQSAPHTGSAIGQLPRGAALIGVVVPGDRDDERWFKIEQGPQTGLYIWARNLSASAPPNLDTSISGPVKLALDTAVYIEPRDGAPVTTSAPASMTAGTMADAAGRIGTDWFELLLPKGGVGYVPAFTIETPEQDADADAVDNVAADEIATPASKDNGVQRARDLMTNYFAAGGGPNDQAIAFVSENYAPSINFYGRQQDRKDVVREKRQYNERWPVRRYDLQPDSPSVTCEEDGTCEVQAMITFYASSPERGATSSGTASIRLTISADGMVVAESGKVLTRF